MESDTNINVEEKMNGSDHSTTVASVEDLSRLYRSDFPILSRQVHGRPLVYLDNAATTQKPQQVIDVVADYYEVYNANIHRGVHLLSQEATQAYENARASIADFVNAAPEEIIFTRGTTEAINLVASTFGETNVGEGDEVIISEMEHHSNIVPWQLLCQRKNARLIILPMNDRGEIDPEEFRSLITERTRFCSFVHISNSLGTINPIAELIEIAHEAGVAVMIDGAQAVAHTTVDVQKLGADFYTLSGHKIYGPTGIGALYGKSDLLRAMPPYQGGGDMIRSVTFEKTTFAEPPARFEAGTPDISGAIGLAEAIRYVSNIGLERIAAWEDELLKYGTKRLEEVAGLRLIGTAAKKAGILSFTLDSAHPHDIGTILDTAGVAVRTGHHCTQPVMQHFSVPATTRASFGLYNSREDIDALVAALAQVEELFG